MNNSVGGDSEWSITGVGTCDFYRERVAFVAITMIAFKAGEDGDVMDTEKELMERPLLQSESWVGWLLKIKGDSQYQFCFEANYYAGLLWL